MIARVESLDSPLCQVLRSCLPGPATRTARSRCKRSVLIQPPSQSPSFAGRSYDRTLCARPHASTARQLLTVDSVVAISRWQTPFEPPSKFMSCGWPHFGGSRDSATQPFIRSCHRYIDAHIGPINPHDARLDRVWRYRGCSSRLQRRCCHCSANDLVRCDADRGFRWDWWCHGAAICR